MKEQLPEEKKWISEEAICLNCGHRWAAVHQGSEFLECSECSFLNHSQGSYPKPLHIIISKIDDQIFLKPSRPIKRADATGLVADALGMLQNASAAILDPKDSPINIAISYFPED